MNIFYQQEDKFFCLLNINSKNALDFYRKTRSPGGKIANV